MNGSMPGLTVHHQLPKFTQTHVHRVGDAIQPSHPRSSPSPPAPIPPSLRIFSNKSTICMRWPKYSVSRDVTLGQSHLPWRLHHGIRKKKKKWWQWCWSWQLQYTMGTYSIIGLRYKLCTHSSFKAHRWGTHVYLWQIHVDIWQNEYNIVK